MRWVMAVDFLRFKASVMERNPDKAMGWLLGASLKGLPSVKAYRVRKAPGRQWSFRNQGCWPRYRMLAAIRANLLA